ncbi:MAG TPA: hypothetical protein ENJ29_05820 [Bacteroidetes bacterium]|nr:hypothetical protein [Bacteroidota bacterium]
MDLLPGLSSLQNLHPLIVHFPIALVVLTLLFEGLWVVTKRDNFREFATWLLYLGAVAAVAGVVTGLWASDSLGHDAPGHEFVHEHRDAMYWTTGILVVIAAAVAFLKDLREGAARKFLIVALLIVNGMLMYGADKGGRLVYEFGMGVKAMQEQAATHEEAGSEETTEHSHEDSGGHQH